MWPTTRFEYLSKDVAEVLSNQELPPRGVCAILTADWHLRDSIPVCRTEGFLDIQWRNMEIVEALQSIYDCPVLHAGDLFHHWRSSPELMAMTIKMLPRQFITIYGNHDLPYHSFSHKTKSALYVLEVGKHVKVVNGVYWETEQREKTQPDSINICGKKVLLGHLAIRAPGYEAVWMDENAMSIDEVFERYDFDILVTGHYHLPFQVWRGGRLLINPGPLTIQAFGHFTNPPNPTVYLLNVEKGKLTEIEIPEPKDTFTSREEKTSKVDSGLIDDFVQSLSELQGQIDIDSNIDQLLKIIEEKYHVHPQVARILHNLFREAQESVNGN
jgi:predicted phosphodiesterase